MANLRDAILVVNAGSSSIKFQIFDVDGGLESVAKGLVEGIGSNPVFSYRDGDGEKETGSLPVEGGHKTAMEHVVKWIRGKEKWKVIGAGHRVVHGGTEFTHPTLVDDAAIEEFLRLTPLAPVHQPHNVAPMKILKELNATLPQVACFDTAFHSHQTKLHKMFALPQKYFYEGVKRYGFHGMSYEFISTQLKELYPNLYKGKTVVCHLGNGASVCALEGGKSIDSSMGMTVIEGVPMGTRTGSIDPGAILHIMKNENKTPDEMTDLISKKSGLLGMSGISNDMRVLREESAKGNEDAKLAIDFFTFRVAQVVASMAAALGGIDGVIFTGGIGENSKETREEILARLTFIKDFEVHVIPTNEELMIARSTLAVIKK